jgi:hypothetical protein
VTKSKIQVTLPKTYAFYLINFCFSLRVFITSLSVKIKYIIILFEEN